MKKIIFLMLFSIVGLQQSVAQTFTFGGLNYTITSPTTVKVAYQNGAPTGNVIIPAQVTYNTNSYLVNYIAYSAFDGCTGLSSVTIPNSVTSIDDYAFNYCSGLAAITIPNSVTNIGIHTFSGCFGLTSVTIPNSVTSIGQFAFSFCSGLTSVTISNSLTNIGEHAFSLCTGLSSVTIPNSVTTIGYGAFNSCTSLTSVTIPNSVTTIGDGAFSSCFALTSVTIPNSVTNIGYGAFESCIGLISVTVNWSTPLAINNTVFQNVDTSTVVLNVPNGTASIYDATDVWTDFIINEALSVAPFSATNGFDLIAYPNPSNNVFNFKMNGANDETVSLLVFDLAGRQIENKVVNANDFKSIALGQNYSSGVYNVIVSQGWNTKSVRLVKR